MSRMIQWCEGPTPSASRPPDIACTESAWRARAIGMLRLQRNHGGAEFDARGVRRHQRHHGQAVEVVGHLRHPRGVHARRFGPLDVGDQLGDLARHVAALGPDHHAESHCIPSLECASRRKFVECRPSAHSAGAITPRLLGQRPHVADQGVQRRAGREHRGGAGVQQLLHVGLGDGAADDDGDVAGVGGAQRVDGPRRSARRAHPRGSKARPDATSSCSAIDTMSSMRCRMPV